MKTVKSFLLVLAAIWGFYSDDNSVFAQSAPLDPWL